MVIGLTPPFASSLCFSSARGNSTLVLWFISGVVIMKMISSTSITSTRGVTLMSAMTPPLSFPLLIAMVQDFLGRA